MRPPTGPAVYHEGCPGVYLFPGGTGDDSTCPEGPSRESCLACEVGPPNETLGP